MAKLVIAHADTASTRSQPLPLQPVPPGTNGGVSFLGLASAGCGGLLMGATYSLAQLADAHLGLLPCGAAACGAHPALLTALAGLAGLLGSLVDSLLGATLQYSGWDERSGKATSTPPTNGDARWVRHVAGRDVLSNTGVNVAASLLTSVATAAAARVCCGAV